MKIFLTASPQERAQRRHRELLEKGVHTTYDEVLEDIIKRDKNDSSRAFAPLKKAEDAMELDTTGLSGNGQQKIGRRIYRIRMCWLE